MGLEELSRDISDMGAVVRRNARAAVEVTSRHVKDDAAQQAERTGLAKYAAAIDYDIEVRGTTVTGEVGPNLGKRQGSFGFVEDAGGGVRSAPQHALRDALEANRADFDRGVQMVIADALGVVFE